MKRIPFRASGVGNLLVNPKLKKDRDAGKLSQTAKSFIQDCWLYNEFGYKQYVVVSQMLKGHLCEQDSMSLVQRLVPSKEFRVKNKYNIKGEYFSGTPDVILKKDRVVEDLKTCWDLKTFFEKKGFEKLYEAQAQVYMHLTGMKKFRLHYCLINTPEELVLEEQKRFYFKFGCDEENPHYQEASEQVAKNHNFDSIPLQLRLKTFCLVYNEEYINELKVRVEKAWSYYNTLNVNELAVLKEIAA